MRIFLIVLFIAIFFSSCWKEEIPIDKAARRGTTYQTIEMGSSYSDVVWFDLSEGLVVKTMQKDAWELLISRKDGLYHMQLNTALFGQAARTESSDWTAVMSESGLAFKSDAPSGGIDSLSIGDWIREEKIWLLDRGYNTQGLPYSKLKIRCSDFQENGFTIEYGAVNSAQGETMFIPISEGDLGLGITLSSDEIIQVYPSEWDLCFTQYVHLFYDPYTPYLVSGVLINDKAGVRAQRLLQAYDDVDFNAIQENNYSAYSNVIGYDWKFFDLDAGQYTVYLEYVYAIKTADERVYKLHFLDFYNSQGERGYPMFAYGE